jgi:predicted dehydrogenase
MPLSWGILSTGAIARTFAQGLTQSRTGGRLVAVGSRSREAAAAFGQQFGVPPDGCHGDYDALLGDPHVEAVYIAPPHPFHAQWAIKAAQAGKHVLCEKPFAMNQRQAHAMFEAARQHNVFMMEAFMYRCHPQIPLLINLIREGAIGEVKAIHAAFAFRGTGSPDSRTLNRHLGGGGILDVGCYPVSLVRLIAGAATGAPFQNPTTVQGVAHIGDTGVDEYAAAMFEFPGDIIAQVATGVRLAMENTARIYGTSGRIIVESPWAASREKPAVTQITVHARDTQTHRIEPDCTCFTAEADIVATAIAAGQTEAPSPAMTWADTLGNMQTLDAWRTAIGLTYDADIDRPADNCGEEK